MYISRNIESSIREVLLKSNNVVILYGARQVGKTTLINRVLEGCDLKVLKINAEESIYKTIFSKRDLKSMQDFTEGYDILFIDEAQTIDEIGVNIKILHDATPKLKIILSGSSSFELANKVQEPLTGRTKTFKLYPIAINELKAYYNRFELKQKIDEFLIQGAYPRLFNISTKQDKISHLHELSSAYLYKDILELANIKHSSIIFKLLKLISFQIGNLVSIHELAQNLKTSSETIERYINLLEKSFVIFRLSGFSKNLRKEIKKQDKIYFYDLGIRNAVINNFADMDFRNDQWQLWENFIIIERMKFNDYASFHKNIYFWRTYTGAELDYIEDFDGKLHGYEVKWGNKIPKAPKTWLNTYENATFNYINKDNFLDFIIS